MIILACVDPSELTSDKWKTPGNTWSYGHWQWVRPTMTRALPMHLARTQSRAYLGFIYRRSATDTPSSCARCWGTGPLCHVFADSDWGPLALFCVLSRLRLSALVSHFSVLDLSQSANNAGFQCTVIPTICTPSKCVTKWEPYGDCTVAEGAGIISSVVRALSLYAQALEGASSSSATNAHLHAGLFACALRFLVLTFIIHFFACKQQLAAHRFVLTHSLNRSLLLRRRQ